MKIRKTGNIAKGKFMKKWTRWRIVESKGRFYIKRNGLGENYGKTQNYPAKKYNDIQDDYNELDSLVLRLNHADDEKRRQQFLIENAFIPQRYVDQFVEYLAGEHDSPKTTREIVSPFIKYGLKYLQNAYGANPAEWPEKEKEWGNYLLRKGFSKSYILSIVQTVNRFLLFTHERNRSTFPIVKLKPLSSVRLKRHEDKRIEKLNVDGKRDPYGYYISDEEKQIIFDNLPKDILPAVKLIDLYGLREAEALGLATNNKCVTKHYLHVDRQLVSVGRNGDSIVTKPPKWGLARNSKHWHSKSLKEVVELFKSVTIMHPDTLQKKFAEAVDGMGLSKKYRLHDFRRTFITNAFDEGRIPTDIMDYVGHKNIKTTLRYRRPKEEKDNEVIEW